MGIYSHHKIWEHIPSIEKIYTSQWIQHILAVEPVVEKAIKAAIARLLIPLVRVILRYGIPYGAFAEIAKRVYVDVALDEFAIPGRKPTISRASVITGLSRKEILRVQRLPDLGEDDAAESYNRAARPASPKSTPTARRPT